MSGRVGNWRIELEDYFGRTLLQAMTAIFARWLGIVTINLPQTSAVLEAIVVPKILSIRSWLIFSSIRTGAIDKPSSYQG